LGDDILIVGGGIGGLAAAVALRRVGVAARVFERADELREVGAGVSLWPNAMRALRDLGLTGAVRDGHPALASIAIYRADGAPLLRLGDSARHGLPAICVHRAQLQGVLAAAIPASHLRLGRTAVNFEEDAGGVTVHFEGGPPARGRVLLGCDGIRSVIRARLHGESEPRYRGYEIWRGVADFALPRAMRPQATEWWAPGMRFGLLPGEGDRIYWYATHTARNPRGTASPDRDRLESLFLRWGSPVPEIIAATGEEDLVRTQAEDRPVRWGRGPVTLGGDAAHPMTPNMGQGACTALEDAVVLADCIRRGGSRPEALREYERLRNRRARWIVRQSRRIGWLAQLEAPAAVELRNRLMRLVPDRLARGLQHRVYGYRTPGEAPA
jgi:2-polyprenyl-6-methoxyphenol hydroxylase-like FAD-dependent oxidoreductase